MTKGGFGSGAISHRMNCMQHEQLIQRAGCNSVSNPQKVSNGVHSEDNTENCDLISTNKKHRCGSFFGLI